MRGVVDVVGRMGRVSKMHVSLAIVLSVACAAMLFILTRASYRFAVNLGDGKTVEIAPVVAR